MCSTTLARHPSHPGSLAGAAAASAGLGASPVAGSAEPVATAVPEPSGVAAGFDFALQLPAITRNNPNPRALALTPDLTAMQATSILLLPALLSVGLAGCTGDDDDGGGGGGTTLEIADAPLAGTVGGAPWTFASGDTDAFLSRDKPELFSDLYGESVSLCGFASGAGNHLIVAIPKTPGDYPFTTQRNMTFVVGGTDNYATLEGKVRVDEVTATSLKGGLVGRFDSANEVTGTFEITICPDM